MVSDKKMQKLKQKAQDLLVNETSPMGTSERYIIQELLYRGASPEQAKAIVEELVTKKVVARVSYGCLALL